MNELFCLRQGDVLLRKVAALPENIELERVSPEAKGLVLAHGKVTGHAHVVDPDLASLYLEKAQTPSTSARRFLEVALANCFIIHDEHAPMPVELGVYEVIRQREYSPWDDEVRYVAD
jgi:hypothetical protein